MGQDIPPASTESQTSQATLMSRIEGDPDRTSSTHRHRRGWGPPLFTFFVIAAGLLAWWLINRESTADRCNRLATDVVINKHNAAAPPPRPSELAWYAEHCYDGKPR